MIIYKNGKIIEYYYENGKKKQKTHKYIPYFYIPEKTFIPDFPEIIKIEETDYKTLFGEKLKKIVCKNPSAVNTIRHNLKQTYEGDLNPAKRFTVDNKDYIQDLSSKTNHILHIDIETQDIDIHSDNEIISIVIYSTFKNEYYQLTWSDKVKQKQYRNMNISTYIFNSEKDMLQKVLDIFNVLQVDCLTGWFFNQFDLPYLFNRLEKLKLNAKSISPTNSYRWVKNNTQISIDGMYCINLDDFYFSLQQSAPDSRKLDYIANKELGLQKTEESGALAADIWKSGDLDRLLKYNLQDVVLMVKLDEKLKLFEFFYELSNFSGAPLDRLSNSNIIDNYILIEAKKQKIALPTLHYGQKEEFKGALVMDPIPGLHKNVAFLDWKSLYPSIMVSGNFSYETFINYMEFKQDEIGFIPGLIDVLFKMRAQYKKMGEDNKQISIKRLMNSIYGLFGFAGSRLFNPKIAESITNTGQEVLKFSKQIANENGFEVIGGDTDSIFLKNINDKQATKVADEINKRIPELMRKFGFNRNIMEIEFEDMAQSVLLMDVKKRYAKLIDGKVFVKGMQTVRSDSPMLGRKIQKTILEAILKGHPEEKIKQYIKLHEKLIKQDKIPLEDILSPMGLQKTKYKNKPIQLRASQYSNKYLGYNFTKGDKLMLAFIKKTPSRYPKTDVIALERGDDLPLGFILDYDRIIDRNITKIIDPIFKVLKWNMGSEQKLI